MKSRVLVSMLVIALAAAVIGGATMAWFTSADVVSNATFTAGTLAIEAGETVIVDDTKIDIVNPGDSFCVCWDIQNKGTKRTELRFDGKTAWDFSFDGEDPAHFAVCPQYADDWKIINKEEGGFELYYTDGPLAAEEVVKVCLVVAFDGPGMGDEFQGQAFTLSGQFDAVQTTNGAPAAVWGENWNAAGDVDAYFTEDFDWPACCGTEDPEPPAPQEYTVTVESCNTDRGTVSGGGTVEAGSNVTVTATTKSYCNRGQTYYYQFDGWYDQCGWGGAKISSDKIYTIENVQSNMTLYAKFSKPFWTCDDGEQGEIQ